MRLFRFYGTLYVFLRTETFVLSVIALSRDANPESLFLFGLWRVLLPPLPSFGTRTLLRHSPDLCHPMADMATLSSSRSPPGADRPSHHSKSFARLMGERTCSCGKPGCLQALRECYLDPASPYPDPANPQLIFEVRDPSLKPDTKKTKHPFAKKAEQPQHPAHAGTVPSEDSAGRARGIFSEDSAGRDRAVLPEDSAGQERTIL